MSGVPYHGWTHMPKEQGGTDPTPGPARLLPWCRRSKESDSDQTIVAGDDEVITWNTSTNDYPDVFNTTGTTIIQVEEDGLYSVVVQIPWSTSPDRVAVRIDSLTPAFNYGYMTTTFETSITLQNYGMLIIRLGANTQLRAIAENFDAVDNDIWGDLGCYMEVVKLGVTTVTDIGAN